LLHATQKLTKGCAGTSLTKLPIKSEIKVLSTDDISLQFVFLMEFKILASKNIKNELKQKFFYSTLTFLEEFVL
jgi:hypothetical protein